MKKVFIWFIAAFSVIAVGLIILMVYAITTGGNIMIFSSNKDLKLVNTQTISMEDIDNIDIAYSSENIAIYTSESNDLILKEYMNHSPKEKELADIAKDGSKLLITGPRWYEKTFININCNSRVEIFLPAQYSSILSVSTASGNINSDLVLKLKQLSIESSSGNISLNEVYADTINVSSTSGNITIQTTEGKSNISSTSGGIKVYNGSGDSDISASSGNITIKNVSGYIDASANSGEINITALKGAADVKTSSGNIIIELLEITNNMDLEASSGNITLKIPDTLNFNFKAKTSSGNIKTFFDDSLSINERGNNASGTIGNATNITLNMEASSGNVTVKRNQ